MQVYGSNLVRAAVVAISTMLPVIAVSDLSKDNQARAVEPKDNKSNSIGKAHEPKYINPKDSSSKIQIQPGSMLMVQTKSFATLPNYLDGTLKVSLEGDRVLRHFHPADNYIVQAHKDPRVEAIIPSALFLAQGVGLTKLTVTFYDKEGKEREKTTYNIEVTNKK